MEELRLLNPRWLASYSARRVAQFVERCHERGVSVTPQRLEVIRALLTSENHPRAEDIYVAVRKRQPLHDSARYDGHVGPHHHVVCVRCRRIRDIEMPEVDKLLDGRTSLGEFSLLGCSLEIDAVCKRCRAQSARTQALRAKPTKDRAYQ